MTAQPVKYGFALVAAAIAVLPLLPFVNKAAHIDDPLFLWSAQHILEHPLEFYGFDVNWYGRTQPMHEVTQNPPLVSYFLALVIRFFGSKEWVLHAAMLISAALTGAGTYLLASRFCARPLLAALFVIVSPAFVVSGTTLMCDMTMLAFWVWAAFLWMLGTEKRSWCWLLFAAMLAGLSALSKYFGASLIPLLAVYTLCQGKGYRRYLAALLVPVAVLLAYELVTAQLYGRGLFLDAVFYASEIEQDYGRDVPGKLLAGLIFMGACTAFSLFSLPILWPRRKAILVLVLLLSGIAVRFCLTSAEIGLDSHNKMLQAIIWCVSGLGLLVLLSLDCSRSRSRDSLLLALWLCGVLFFACFVNHYINGRVMLPAVVPAAILLVRKLDADAHALNMPVVVSALLCLLVSLQVAGADYRLARNGKRAAQDAVAAPHEGRLWFVGHWGFQYYMEQAGALPLELERPRFREGETVVVPSNNTNLIKLDPAMIAMSTVMRYAGFPSTSTMDRTTGAGFHSDVWGPLPFVFGPSVDESYVRIVLAPPPSANP